ncbi:hypothetical protein FA95DRAFT_1124574 [Auriscalpium vulgare]|uniref:Uncharacterized protein n=1 Tax=Auriscalpium vulgare TaxID=40419 RepID=A0ACB8RVM5_9AGAM|nr:hypothetical protein FA95DRAFT_1124574 [Auriscalpium vulgare]
MSAGAASNAAMAQIIANRTAHLLPVLTHGYLGNMLGHKEAMDLICAAFLRFAYTAHVDDAVWAITYSAPGLQNTFTVNVASHSFPHLQPYAVDPTSPYLQVILDYIVPDLRISRVIRQHRWVQYRGGLRWRVNLENEAIHVVPPIFFVGANHLAGVPLLHARGALLDEASLLCHDRLPFPLKTSIKLRVWLHGREPWCAQIRLRTRGTQSPVTLAVFLQRVARLLDNYFRCGGTGHAAGSSTDAQLNPSDIIIVGVVAVSSGSVMPILQIV